MWRVALLDILQISHPTPTDNQHLRLAKILVIDCLCYVPSNIKRTILRIYRCYHIIQSIIRGCEIVFVSLNRLIFMSNN